MNSEERKMYNKNYYQSHRNEILKVACEKIECEFCKRKVIKNNILKHQKTILCKNQEKLNIEREKRLKQKTEVENEKQDIIEPVEPVEPVESNVKKLIKKFENK